MVQTTKLARLRGNRSRISSATNGSRMKAMVTAMMDVMKKSRPKYRIATITPTAMTGSARCRASCTVLVVRLTGLVTSATARKTLVSTVAWRHL